MQCMDVQNAILMSFDAESSTLAQPAIDQHVATCPTCQAFAAKQRRLHGQLRALMGAPELTTEFRAGLRDRLSRNTQPVWVDVLPDLVHFVSFGVATVLCALWLPVDPQIVLATGLAVALSTYIPLAVVRGSIEDAR